MKRIQIKSLNAKALAATSLFLLSSCATIMSGGSPKITINGDVPEPVTITTEKKSYTGTLPLVVKVKRHHLEGQRIKISSEHYKFDDIILNKTINGYAFGNIIIGGIIGWGIDLCTNCVCVPLQTTYDIKPLARTLSETAVPNKNTSK